MPYWEIVTRSFRIAWEHKYLWLVALFSGEGGSGGNYNYRQGTTTPSGPGTPDFGAVLQQALQQVGAWISAHVALIIGIGVAWLVVAIAFFILAAVCEGATVRGSAEHDAGRPFGLGQAWRTGVHLMWVMVRFRLLIFLLNIPILLLIGGWTVALISAVINHSSGSGGPLALTGTALIIVWIVYGTYLFFLDRFGARAVVLEERMAVPALARAHRLLTKRLGRSLLVWLLSLAVALVVGIALACVLAIVVVPFIAIGAAITAASGSSGPPIGLIVLGVILLIPLSLLIGGFFAAQGSTYWTLAFRRLDIDYAPAYGYTPAPQAPPAAQG